MAKMFGYELKGIKSFVGHDGEELKQGNLYYNGKKVAFWSQDSWGGPDTFLFESSLGKGGIEKARENLNIAVSKYKDSDYCDPKYKEFADRDVFVGELLELNELEKKYKSYQKRGYDAMCVVTNGFYEHRQAVRGITDIAAANNIFSNFINTATEEIKESCKDKCKWCASYAIKTFIYLSLEDFIVR